MKTMRGIIIFIYIILFTFIALAGEMWDDAVDLYVKGEINVSEEQAKNQTPIFEIKIANGGSLTGELYPDVAPESVGNFIALANSGYYDGLLFHRVIPGFMIQGGCPLGTGTGGPGWHIKGEFSANGKDNPIKHNYGVLSMARAMANDSAGSQFFIMVSDSPHLDGNYAAFGKVLEGMEHAEDIVKIQTDSNDRPITEQKIDSIRVETFEVEYKFTKLP